MTDSVEGAKAGSRDAGFFRVLVTVMAIVQVAGFVVQLAAGRSSFGAPPIVHAHAVVAMAWVAVFAAQAWLAASGARSTHRRLGAVALVLALVFVALAIVVTVQAARTGRVPFFFQPQLFVLFDPATAFGFLGLFLAAVATRGTDWHPRLQVAAFVLIMGPSFGRMLPLPLLTPYAFEIATLPALIFPIVGMIRDARVHGRIHPAWVAPFVVLLVMVGGARMIGVSPLGAEIYQAVVAGTPAAGQDGLAFPPPPPMPPAS